MANIVDSMPSPSSRSIASSMSRGPPWPRSSRTILTARLSKSKTAPGQRAMRLCYEVRLDEASFHLFIAHGRPIGISPTSRP